MIYPKVPVVRTWCTEDETRPVTAMMPRLTAARESQSGPHPAGLDAFKIA